MSSLRIIRNSADGAVLSVFGEIGLEGLQLANFRVALENIKGAAVTVEINSPGGDVFAAVPIYNYLRDSGKNVTTKVVGYAASAASLVFMAGSQRVMPANTYLMVHNARCATSGTAEELRKSADKIDQIDATMRGLYAAHTGLSDAALRKMLAVDTWMDAAESKRLRFATAVVGAIDAQASFAPRASMPAHVRAALATKPTAPRAATHHADIRSLCKIADRPQDAEGFISAGTTLNEVRAALLPGLSSSTGASSTAAIWSRRK